MQHSCVQLSEHGRCGPQLLLACVVHRGALQQSVAMQALQLLQGARALVAAASQQATRAAAACLTHRACLSSSAAPEPTQQQQHSFQPLPSALVQALSQAVQGRVSSAASVLQQHGKDESYHGALPPQLVREILAVCC